MNLQNASVSIAKTASPNVGFDPITIISALLPLLVSCFKQTEPQATPKEYLEDHFDETTGTFDQSLINRCRPQTRRAARRDGQRRLSREQLDQITVATLEHARTADDDTVAAIMIECGE